MDKSVSGQQNFRSNLVSLELNLALVPHHPLLDFGKKILPKKAIHSHNQVQGFVPILWSFFPKWDWLWSAHSTIPLLMAEKQSKTQFAKVLETGWRQGKFADIYYIFIIFMIVNQNWQHSLCFWTRPGETHPHLSEHQHLPMKLPAFFGGPGKELFSIMQKEQLILSTSW